MIDGLTREELLDVITVTRILEYHGPRKWVESTLEASKIPVIGTHKVGTGAIRSGLVKYDAGQPEERPEQPAPAERPATRTGPAGPPRPTMVLPRPSGKE